MSLLSNIKFFIFVLVLILLIPVLLYIYLTLPVLNESKSLAVELDQKKQEYAELTKETEVEDADDPFDVIQLSQVRAQIPEQPYIDRMIRDLRRLEVVGGVETSTFDIEISEVPLHAQKDGLPDTLTISDHASALVNEVKLTAQVEGTYAQIQRVLEEVETMDRITHVERMMIRVRTDYEPSFHISINLADKILQSTITLVSYFAPGLEQFYDTPIEAEYDPPRKRSTPIY